MKKSFDDDDAATASHADAADSALQSVQQTAIDICKCCTASGGALAKKTSERRHLLVKTVNKPTINQQINQP